MADWYIDHENTTLYPTAYMSVPASAASLPQDGDGMASGTGAAPHVAAASWDLTSSSASAGTMTCMGASITGLTASGSALATAIATAINASTAAVTAANGGVTSPYLKALVWAVAAGAVLTVHTRIASASLNQANNANAIMATGTGWTAPPATANFSGGVSGPWCYLFNTTALTAAVASGNSGAVGLYGAWPAPMMGTPAAGDVCHIRTKRSGADITLTWPTTTNCTPVIRNIGTRTAMMTWLFDNGIKWSGDAGTFTMVASGATMLSKSITFPAAADSSVRLAGVKLTDTTCNWKIQITGTYTTYSFDIRGNAFASYHEIVALQVSQVSTPNYSGSGGSYFNIRPAYSTSAPRNTPNITLKHCVIASSVLRSPLGMQDTYNSWLRAEDCVFDATGLTSQTDYAILNMGAGNLGRFDAVRCRWINYPAAQNKAGWQVNTGNLCTITLRDCTFDNIQCAGLLVGGAEPNANGDILRGCYVSSAVANRPFIDETSFRSFAWFDSAMPKTLSSTLPDGVTTFSVRTAVTSEAGKVSVSNQVRFPRIAKLNSLASGTRTATLRLLVDNNIRAALGARDPNNAEMYIDVSYINTSGLPKLATTRAIVGATPAAVSAGTAGDWSAVQYDVNGVTHYYTAFEIAVTLTDLLTGAEIGLEFCQGCQTTSIDNLVILDPEWSLA